MYKTSLRENGTLRVQTINVEPTMTQQQFKDECDINFIMEKYNKTGLINHINTKKGVYADLSEISDYRDMLDTVRHADDVFMTLPASTRKRFDNDPAKLISFLQDDKNYEEAQALGLLERKDLPTKNMPKNDAIQRDEKTAKKNDKSKTAQTTETPE